MQSIEAFFFNENNSILSSVNNYILIALALTATFATFNLLVNSVGGLVAPGEEGSGKLISPIFMKENGTKKRGGG